MKEFLTQVGSVYWWMSVVAVGIIINLASAYLKYPMDRYLSTVSVRWRNKSEVRKAEWLRKVRELRADPTEQYMFGIEELRLRLQSFWDVLWGFLGCIVAVLVGDPGNLFGTAPLWNRVVGWVIMLVSSLKLFHGVWSHYRAFEMERMFKESRNVRLEGK
jgi:hypothetical protein